MDALRRRAFELATGMVARQEREHESPAENDGDDDDENEDATTRQARWFGELEAELCVGRERLGAARIARSGSGHGVSVSSWSRTVGGRFLSTAYATGTNKRVEAVA